MEEDNAAAAAAIEAAQNPRRSASGLPQQTVDPRKSASGMPSQTVDPRKSASGIPPLKNFSDKKRTPTQNNMPQLIFPKEAQSQFSQPSELPRPEPESTQVPPPEVPRTPFEPPSATPASAPPMEPEWSRSQAPIQIPEPPKAQEHELEPIQDNFPGTFSEPQTDNDILAQVEANYSAFAPQIPNAPEPDTGIDESSYDSPSIEYDPSTFAPDAPAPTFETSAPSPTGTGLRQARGQIIAAESAFENQNFDVAVPLFERILKLLREDLGQGEPEYLIALQKLGDCYFHRGEYERAMPLYLESSNLPSQRTTSAGPGAIVNLQKLSRTYEKLERQEDAELAGGEAIELANMTLPPGHPLITVVYKSYIAMLEAAGAPKIKLKTYERELQDRLSSAAGSPSVALTEDYESDLKAWTNYESFDLEPVKQQHQAQMNKQRMQASNSRSRGEFKKPFKIPNLKPVLFVSAAVLVVGGMAVVGIGALLNTGPATKKQMIDARLGPYLGKSFISADGAKTLTVNQDGTASIAFGDDNQIYPCEIGGGAQDMLSTARKMAGAQQDYILKETKQGFEDPSGTILYSENAEDKKILKSMEKVAELAGYSFSRKKTRYPVKRKDFSELGPGIELYSPLELKFAQFDEDEGTTRFNETLQDMKAGRPLFGPDGKPDIPSGLIECMSVVPFVDNANVKGIGFLIRAYNKEGKFIKGADDSVRVIALKNGVEVPTVEKKDVSSPIKAGSKAMVFLELAK